MASFFSGSTGVLQFGGGKVIGKVRDWSFTSNVQMLPTTSLGQTDATVTNGIRSQSGSFTLHYYDEKDSSTTIYASTVIGKLLKAATKFSDDTAVAAENETFKLRLRINKGSTSGKWVQGDVYLTSVAMTMAVGEVLAAQSAFTVNGAFEEVTI